MGEDHFRMYFQVYIQTHISEIELSLIVRNVHYVLILMDIAY